MGIPIGVNNPGAFVRDFTIASGSYLDTLTVRSSAVTDQDISNATYFYNSWGSEYAPQRYPNTTISGASTLPSYEYSAYNGTYPGQQFMADKNGGNTFGFSKKYSVEDNSSFIDTCTSIFTNRIEVGEFIRVIDLPNIPGGYHLYFEIGNRNVNIKNIRNPGITGFTLYTRIPDLALFETSSDSYKKLYDA